LSKKCGRAEAKTKGLPIVIRPMQIGVLSQGELRKRTLAIARGELKVDRYEPKLWFPSLEALSQVLTNENLALIRLIATSKPPSIAELARLAGKSLASTSKSVRKLARYGFVALERRGRCLTPVATTREIRIWMPLDFTL
jgi:predicted transcriptional regulator